MQGFEHLVLKEQKFNRKGIFIQFDTYLTETFQAKNIILNTLKSKLTVFLNVQKT